MDRDLPIGMCPSIMIYNPGCVRVMWFTIRDVSKHYDLQSGVCPSIEIYNPGCVRADLFLEQWLWAVYVVYVDLLLELG